MEKDRHISKLIRESGIAKAPEDFTQKVMTRIGAESVHKPYKPLIGRTGGIITLLLIAGIAVTSLILSSPGESGEGILETLKPAGWQWPSLRLELGFLEHLNFSPWLIGTVMAVFLLILSDVGLHRRKLS
ncbi:MAG: hypothetical protein ACWGNV_15190 [Bacteroidales bacterium]